MPLKASRLKNLLIDTKITNNKLYSQVFLYRNNYFYTQLRQELIVIRIISTNATYETGYQLFYSKLPDQLFLFFLRRNKMSIRKNLKI
jgi:hypothetical protein